MQTLVCVLSYTSSVAAIFCIARAITATVMPIGMKICTMVELRPGTVFCRLGGDIFRDQERDQERGSMDHFGLSDTYMFAI